MRLELDHVSPRGWPRLFNIVCNANHQQTCRKHHIDANVSKTVWHPCGSGAHYSVRAAPLTKRRLSGAPGKRKAPPRLDQFYTRDAIAAWYLQVVDKLLCTASYQMVEPSAGSGAFFRQMPACSVAFDKEPKCHGIITEDFLTIEMRSDRPIMTVGNPPFGKNSSLAVQFFNRAAKWSKVIAMIFPRSFLKASIENQLDSAFHLTHQEDVPRNAFTHNGKCRNVNAVFQIWEKRDPPRNLRPEENTHPDFKFSTPELFDFVIRRVGANAGKITFDREVHEDSHYFIKGDVLDIMLQLDFAGAARNATSTPSLARSEIVELYREWIKKYGNTGRK